VHVITEKTQAEQVAALLRTLPDVTEVRIASVGGPARLI
jgi:hypothetical protein